jgi:hypothetical protein
MEWIPDYINEFSRRTNVVSKTTNWSRSSVHVILLPLSKKIDNEVTLEFLVEDL